MLTRRHFIMTTAAMFSPPIAGQALAQSSSLQSKWDAWDAQVTPPNYNPATTNPWGLHPRFLPTLVEAKPGLTPGDIHVDAVARYLYHIR
ncbi:MAG: L,D-transpeptidase, partial [Maritimibacter harenae]